MACAGSYWPPWYSLTNNIATFDPAAYDTANQAVVNPATGRIVSGPRYNGIVLPGDGFKGDGNDLAVAQDPAVLALFVGAPRGFAKTHANVFEPRLGAAYSLDEQTIVKVSAGVFHNRVTVSDSMFLGGNPPFQPQVGVSNGLRGQSRRRRRRRHAALRHDGDRSRVQAPDRVHVVGWRAAAGAVQLHPRRDLRWPARPLQRQRERDINQLQPGTVQANPGVNVAALRPYKGYGVIRLSENAASSKYHSLQVSADRRYTNGFKFGVAYTLGKSQDDASGQRDVLFNNYDDSGFWGNSGFDRRHSLNFYYIYDLPFYQGAGRSDREGAGRMADLGRDVHALGHAAVGHRRGGHRGHGRYVRESVEPQRRSERQRERGVLGAAPPPIRTSGSIRRRSRGRPPARSATAQRNNIYNPGQYQWDIALFKNVSLGGTKTVQFRAEIFNFLNHANWNGADANPTSATFGRVTGKADDRRDIQLSLRFMF